MMEHKSFLSIFPDNFVTRRSVDFLRDLCSVQSLKWCLEERTQFEHFLQSRRKPSTLLSHMILICELPLLMTCSVFANENSAFSFQDLNSILKIRLQWSDFLKTWIWIRTIKQLQRYPQAECFCSCNKTRGTNFAFTCFMLKFFDQYELNSAIQNVQNIRYFSNRYSSVFSNNLFDFLHVFIRRWSRPKNWALFIFTLFSFTTKSSKPLVYTFSTEGSIPLKSDKHFMGFCSRLVQFKTKFHFYSLYDFIALHALQQRCETYCHVSE
jgi:hypothetical protein